MLKKLKNCTRFELRVLVHRLCHLSELNSQQHSVWEHFSIQISIRSTILLPEVTYYMAKTRAEGTSGGDITSRDQVLLDESIVKEKGLDCGQDE